jgi:hypothetical protein
VKEEDVHITLTDLTLDQKQMLEKIWSFDRAEDLQAFRDSLPRFRQQELDTLVQMLIMEFEDQRATEDLSMAQDMLRELGYRV